MTSYCYDIITDEEYDPEDVIDHVKSIYTDVHIDDHFTEDEELPFIIYHAKNIKKVCIRVRGNSKKVITRINHIHDQLDDDPVTHPNSILHISSDIQLGHPKEFGAEQQDWTEKELELKGDVKWKTLSHHGPYFTHIMEPYIPHNIPIKYNGRSIRLNPEAEKVAMFYVNRIITEKTSTVKHLSSATFRDNFFTDFKKYLTPELRKIIVDLDSIDFSAIVQYKEKLTEDKKKNKVPINLAAQERKTNYGYAIVDGRREAVQNFTVEPASIYSGRGKNPKSGKIKRDVNPEDVIINIGKDDPVPIPPPGHKWKQVVHIPTNEWLASWRDSITGDVKYMRLARDSEITTKSDYTKYEKVRKLQKYIKQIREKYTNDMESQNKRTQQIGTILYLIDHFGIRIGNEKGEDEAQTIGATTLQVGNLQFKDDNIIVLDFLGKDSVRFFKELHVNDEVYHNLRNYTKNKSDDDLLFDQISSKSQDVNDYLKSFDKDFTAKMFRTRLASRTMYNELINNEPDETDIEDVKVKIFKNANIIVANTLNHIRSIPQKSQQQIDKLEKQLQDLKVKRKEQKSKDKNLSKIDEQILKKKNMIDLKSNTQDIALNTSLQNYIDPRLVVAWTKRHDVNINKIYPKGMRTKFKWAIDTTEGDWDWLNTPLHRGLDKLNPKDNKRSSKSKTQPKSQSKTQPKKTEPKLQDNEVIPGVYITKYANKYYVVYGKLNSEHKQIIKNAKGMHADKLKQPPHSGWIIDEKYYTTLKNDLLNSQKQDENDEEDEKDEEDDNDGDQEDDEELDITDWMGMHYIKYKQSIMVYGTQTHNYQDIFKKFKGQWNRKLKEFPYKAWRFTPIQFELMKKYVESQNSSSKDIRMMKEYIRCAEETADIMEISTMDVLQIMKSELSLVNKYLKNSEFRKLVDSE